MEHHVRQDSTCPLCLGIKDCGLVLCWPCHRKEKAANHGCYSDFAERRIAATEKLLRETEDARKRHTANVVSLVMTILEAAEKRS